MFKKLGRILVLTVIFVIVLGSVSVFACTAFMVVDDEGYIYYAKNWDFNPERTDTVFTLENVSGNLKRLDVRLSNSGYLCSAYNSDGFFITTNGNRGQIEIEKITDDMLVLRDLHEESMGTTSSVDQLIEYIGEQRLVSPLYFQEHLFVADAGGNACAVETDNFTNYFTYDENNLLIVTNTPNYEIREYTVLEDMPCQRYAMLYSYLSESARDYNACIEGLKLTAKDRVDGKTNYSLIVDPQKNVVYLFLNREFDKPWEISMEKGTISTYEGFNKSHTFEFDHDGISFIELWAFQSNPERFTAETPTQTEESIEEVHQDLDSKNIKWLYAILPAIFLITGIAILLIRKRKKTDKCI